MRNPIQQNEATFLITVLLGTATIGIFINHLIDYLSDQRAHRSYAFNMKNRQRFLFIVSLLVLIFFWIWKIRNSTALADIATNSPKARSLKLLEERIRMQKAKSSATAPSTNDKRIAGFDQKSTAPEKSCWEKISDQYQIDPDYLIQSHQRLNEIVGDWFYSNSNRPSNVNIKESSPQGKFFLALAKAGLLIGLQIEQNEDQALLLLEQVAKTDPQNSASFLFAAIIENRRGNIVQVQELLNEANKSTHFDSYLKDFTFALFDGVKTPSDLLSAQEIWSKSPIPNYAALLELLKKNKRPNIAHQLVKDGLREDRERIPDISWIPIEYAIGKKLLDSYGIEKKIPHYSDLILKYSSTTGESGKSIFSTLDLTCNLESIQDEVTVYRKYLDQVRTNGL